MHVAIFRASPKKYISSNFLVVVILIPGHNTKFVIFVIIRHKFVKCGRCRMYKNDENSLGLI